MNQQVALAFLLAITAHSVCAHEETPLAVLPDGVLSGLPKSFGRVTLHVAHDSTPASILTFETGGHSFTAPACLTRPIRTKSLSSVEVSGSWYHQVSSLPHYVAVTFVDPWYEGQVMASKYSFLFNLHIATLVHVMRWSVKGFGPWKSVHVTDVPLVCGTR